MANLLPKLEGELRAQVTTARRLKELNAQYGGEEQATDVLSFNYRENPDPTLDAKDRVLGEVAVSAEHVARQAKRAKTPPATELALLVLHGILHVFGFDHQDRGSKLQMDELQRNVMKTAGLAYRNFNWK